MNKWRTNWMVIALLAFVGAGCDVPNRSAGEALADSPEPVSRLPTPEEAMRLPIAKPLAADTEDWIAGSDLGDAWEEAKTRVASLRQRLVEDYNRRAESGVGETEASRDMRKEYLRWVGIHDNLKSFILICQARGVKRELPPELAGNFKDWGRLHAETLRTGDDEIARWEQEAGSLRQELSRLRAQGDGAGSGAYERLAKRVREGRSAVEALRGRTEAVAMRYGTKGRIYGLAERVEELAADWGELSVAVEGDTVRRNDRERLSEFTGACGRMEEWMRTLSSRVEAKNARIEEEKALARSLRRSRGGGNAAVVARYREACERDHADGARALQDIQAFRQYFDDKAFARFLRGFSEGSRGTLASRRDEVKRSIPAGRRPDTYLNNLDGKASQLRDSSEKSILAELEALVRP